MTLKFGQRSLKVLQTGTIQKLFHTPCIRRPRYRGPRRYVAIPFGVEN